MEVDTPDENMNESFDANVFPDLLPTYYNRLFPFSLYYKWLRYNDDKLFINREFSFTLRDDVYIRYQSFRDEEELKKEIIQKCPFKIDIGAVYSCRPSDQRTASNFHPVEKELVFDIDMTDYDEIRTCCSGADICRKCWVFMTIALKILDRALREDFGFDHLLWVYSGRRGIHCWVCDKQARELSPTARTAIVEYLSVVRGGEYKSKKVHLPEMLHPSIGEADTIIKEYFEDLIINKQDFFESSENCEKVISMCLDQTGKDILKSGLINESGSAKKWKVIKEVEETVMHQKGSKNRSKHFITEVMFQLCYPRLDINVTKGLNHLLKAPFCVHPKTGCVCVPIDPNEIDSFDPFDVPTISRLCKEIDEYNSTLKADDMNDEANIPNKIPDYNKTRLKKSIEIFKTFVENLNSANTDP
ncbi:DNA primase small subunit [Parasteatoda tepidariorum]|uniref:DNA primase small subunit n=1 Tax=Parasteatoda tepidariorum TaxID=114398 RepID=UPI001C720622|nr:DNA primase small subunit [Parasteatoda tepidariorum]